MTVETWMWSATVDDAQLAQLDDAIQELGGALDVAEGPSAGTWKLTAFFDGALDKASLEAELAKHQKSAVVLTGLAPTDYVAKTMAGFPPLEIGRYWVHGFAEQTPPAGKIGLFIPAAMAFGTGEHATTEACLRLYDELADGQTFVNVLDMGAGSGILAIAAAKRQGSPALAVDIDEPSVELCAENCRLNGVEGKVASLAGDGFNVNKVIEKQPFDLVFANILRNPLIEMAPALAASVGKGGYAVLSGFTLDQEADVTAAYVAQGMTPVKAQRLRGWVGLVVQK